MAVDLPGVHAVALDTTRVYVAGVGAVQGGDASPCRTGTCARWSTTSPPRSRCDGAAVCAVSYGRVPGEIYCGHRFLDVLVHGWDVARATGQNTALPPDLVNAAIEVLTPQADMLAASGMFATDVDVPADGDAQTRLLAMLGRRP